MRLNRNSQQSLLEGPITGPLLRLAWPVVIGFLVQYLFEVVDLAWVGRLERAEVPLAAVGLGAFVTWLLNSVIQLVVLGTTTLVAQAIGRGDPERAREVGRSGLAFGLPFGVCLSVGGLLTLNPLLGHLGMDAPVAEEARSYLRIIYLGLPWTYWLLCFDAIQRGSGDTMTPLKIGALAFGLNAVLDPILIFGLGPIPALGVEGAAVASVTSKATGLMIYAVLSRRGRLLVPAGEAGFRFQPATMLACARIGFPVSVVGILFMFVHIELVKVVAPFGPGAIAALAVGARIEGLTYVVVDALAVATQTMVGQNIGADQPRRALRATWLAVTWGSLVGLLMTFLMFFAPRVLVGALASNASPEAIAECVRYCRITAICQVFMVLEIVLTGAFAGVGYTLPAMLNSVPITVSRVPISVVLTTLAGFETAAVFWTISATCCLRGVVATVWFRFGRWRGKYLFPSPEAEPAAEVQSAGLLG